MAREIRLPNWLPALALAFAVGLLVPRAASAQTTTALVPIVPCRMMDTRQWSLNSYPYPYGQGPFTPLSKRTLTVTGPISGILPPVNPCQNVIPSGGVVTALSVNLTIVQPNALGDLREVPGPDPGGNLPTSIMNFPGGIFAIANAATIPVSNDQITLQEVGATANVVMDVMGYYTNTLSSSSPVVAGINNGTGNGVAGYSAAANGVVGFGVAGNGVLGATLGSGSVAGVEGNAGAADGVQGNAATGNGVHGTTSSTGVGVNAEGSGAGSEALRVSNGALRITGATPAAFRLTVHTGAGGNACAPTGGALWVAVDSPYTDGDPNALVFPVAVNNERALGVLYVMPPAPCAASQWMVYHVDGSDVGEGEQMNILIVKP